MEINLNVALVHSPNWCFSHVGSSGSAGTAYRLDSQDSTASADGCDGAAGASSSNTWNSGRQPSVSLREWDIPYEDLTIGEKIGSGRFSTGERK